MTVELVRKTALAIRHVHFEDLGVFEDVLAEAGYAIRYHDVGVDRFEDINPLAPDLLVVLGGPIGVYEIETYPFIEDELRLLDRRLSYGRPTLGLCLGAQLMATSLGAPVGSMGHKEIGFSPLALTDAGRAGPLRHLDGVPVLHWHGDAFEIPDGLTPLASTPLCPTQAFAAGPNILGLQFMPRSTHRRASSAGSSAMPPNWPARASIRETCEKTPHATAPSCATRPGAC